MFAIVRLIVSIFTRNTRNTVTLAIDAIDTTETRYTAKLQNERRSQYWSN